MSDVNFQGVSFDDLDDHIAQVAYMMDVWKRHADLHGATAYGELVNDIARGYARELDALSEMRAQWSCQVREGPIIGGTMQAPER